MATGVETLIQNDLAAILQGIGLVGIDPANVGKIRERPSVDEMIDPLPCVVICSRGPDTSKGLAFEGAMDRSYVEEIIIIDGREGDGATDMPVIQNWKEQCVNAVDRLPGGDFRIKLTTATTVYDLRVGDVATIDRTKLADNYAVLSFFVTARSSE